MLLPLTSIFGSEWKKKYSWNPGRTQRLIANHPSNSPPDKLLRLGEDTKKNFRKKLAGDEVRKSNPINWL